jgi:AAA family ATP:ADP antiporter
MRDKLHALLRIKSGEEAMVSMLLTQSVFLGIFIGAFDISAHSLLLSAYSEKIMARGYIVSGITGIILTFIFNWLKTRTQFKNILVVNLLAATLLTLLLWSAMVIFPVKWIVFLVFILFAPLNILILLGFWGMCERLFSREQGKRLQPIAGTGIVTGTILISVIIPILLSFRFQVTDIFLVSTLSVFIVAVIQIMIGNRFILEGVRGVQDRKFFGNLQLRSIVFHEDPYLRVIGFFSALSVFTAIFIQYSFMAVTRELYPVAENMAGFLCLFTGSTMVMVLFLKFVVFDLFLHTYGLKACLISTPLLVGVFATMAITIGSALGYTPDVPGGFIIFFILIATARLISTALKESVESPSLRIVNQSVMKRIGTEILSGIPAIENNLLILFSGIILTVLGLFSAVKIIHFTLLLFIISFLWLYIAFRLYKEYRNSVHRIAENIVSSRTEVGDSQLKYDFKNKFAAQIMFRKDYFRLISDNSPGMNSIDNKWYYEKIIDYSIAKKDFNLIPVLKKTSVNSGLSENVRKRSAEAARILQEFYSSYKPGNDIGSGAMRTLSGTRKPQTTEILRLLRDSSIESKRLAVYMIGKFGMEDLSSEVCGCLGISGLSSDASEVLNTFGKEAENALIRLYLSSSGNTGLSRTILQLLGKRCNSDITGFLVSRLWSNSRQLKEIALKCLINCNFIASEKETERLNQLTSEIIGIITWCLAAKISLQRANDTFLSEKISNEIIRWNRFLFNLLSVTYNPETISIIKENVENGTVESVSYALEMTDTLVSDSINTQLIYLLDMVPDEIKLRNLFQFYSVDIPEPKKILEDIINRDYNLISLWTKACALRTLTGIEDNDMAESVTALLFSPEEIIREESAYLITRSNPELYNSASERIPDLVRNRLDNIINGTREKREMLFEKVLFLSTLFGGIPEDELLSLASELKFRNNTGEDAGYMTEAIIIWTIPDDNLNKRVYVLYDLEGNDPEPLINQWKKYPCYYLPLVAIEQFHFQYPENSLEILKYIDDIGS